MIDINKMRRLALDGDLAAMQEIILRLEAAESECLEQARLNVMGSEREAALMAKLEAAEKSDAESIAMYRKARDERDALRAKITEMEQQGPVGKFTQHPSNGLWEQDGYGDNPDATPLYALPGAQNIPEKLCYDSRWEISIDYVDGWNAAVDMMRGKFPSWHCPDCCIAFPFGAPKSCPHYDARCNSLLAAASPEAKP